MLPFCKYSGCGNDFILMDMPSASIDFSRLALRLCERKWGIGADGLILLEPSQKADFKVHFYNADGSIAEMCGNGLRSAVHYFLKKNGTSLFATVETKERILEAWLEKASVKVSMGEALNISLHREIECGPDLLSLASMNTGVPHAVLFTEDIHAFDLETIGRKVRTHHAFAPQGTNFNGVQIISNKEIEIRTYERGVEGETLSCGTGATAAAIAASLLYNIPPPINVRVKSGAFLTIDFELIDGKPTNLTMSGSCSRIFHGEIPLNSSLCLEYDSPLINSGGKHGEDRKPSASAESSYFKSEQTDGGVCKVQ